MAFQRKRTFRGGLHLHERPGGKALTGAMPVREIEAPKQVAIPLSQHAGAPAIALCKAGDIVALGQKIGEPCGHVSAAVHASVSGKVLGIQSRTGVNGLPVSAIVIENDFEDRPAPRALPEGDPLALSGGEIAARVREAGIVGLGGAMFPTHVKLTPPADKPIQAVILNGAECEPYLTCDHRQMLAEAEQIVDGLAICMRALGARRGLIGIERNKPDAIASMRAAVCAQLGPRRKAQAELGEVRVVTLATKYPQGGEKQLIQVLTGRQVPSGGLPMDVGAVVFNVATAAAISRAVRAGTPLTERIVTVSGMVAQPGNYRVRLGDSVRHVLEAAGGALPGADKLVLGGPMMGPAACSLNTPFIKGIAGLLALRDVVVPPEKLGNCIRCGECMRVCPIHLMPMELYARVKRSLFAQCGDFHALDCIECGACSYVCPASLPLAHAIRVAKRELMKAK